MDVLTYLANIEHRADALIANAVALKADLGQARTLYQSQIEQWSGVMRETTRPCPPSELPDSKLGSALAKVRDYLRPAPGRPVDPEFDRVVASVGIPDARERAEHLADHHRPADEIWLALRDTARNRRSGMERAE